MIELFPRMPIPKLTNTIRNWWIIYRKPLEDEKADIAFGAQNFQLKGFDFWTTFQKETCKNFDLPSFSFLFSESEVFRKLREKIFFLWRQTCSVKSDSNLNKKELFSVFNLWSLLYKMGGIKLRLMNLRLKFHSWDSKLISEIEKTENHWIAYQILSN